MMSLDLFMLMLMLYYTNTILRYATIQIRSGYKGTFASLTVIEGSR